MGNLTPLRKFTISTLSLNKTFFLGRIFFSRNQFFSRPGANAIDRIINTGLVRLGLLLVLYTESINVILIPVVEGQYADCISVNYTLDS